MPATPVLRESEMLRRCVPPRLNTLATRVNIRVRRASEVYFCVQTAKAGNTQSPWEAIDCPSLTGPEALSSSELFIL